MIKSSLFLALVLGALPSVASAAGNTIEDKLDADSAAHAKAEQQLKRELDADSAAHNRAEFQLRHELDADAAANAKAQAKLSKQIASLRYEMNAANAAVADCESSSATKFATKFAERLARLACAPKADVAAARLYEFTALEQKLASAKADWDKKWSEFEAYRRETSGRFAAIEASIGGLDEKVERLGGSRFGSSDEFYVFGVVVGHKTGVLAGPGLGLSLPIAGGTWQTDVETAIGYSSRRLGFTSTLRLHPETHGLWIGPHVRLLADTDHDLVISNFGGAAGLSVGRSWSDVTLLVDLGGGLTGNPHTGGFSRDIEASLAVAYRF